MSKEVLIYIPEAYGELIDTQKEINEAIKKYTEASNARVLELEKEIDETIIDLDDYCEKIGGGFEAIFWSAENLADKSMMEDFAKIVEKHGTKKMQNWLTAMITKFGA